MPVDFHTHVLPGIDDGSRNVETSLAMIRAERMQGVTQMIATPHFYAQRDSVDAFLKRRQASYEQLHAAMRASGLEMPISLAAEVAYFPQIGSAERMAELCVEGTKTLLLEMPFVQWTDEVYEDVEKLVQKQKFAVVIAHIERYLSFQKQKKIWNAVMALPLFKQMNAGVFLDWKRRRGGFRLAKEQGPVILGSDCHNTESRKPNLTDGRAALEKKFGKAWLAQSDLLTEELLQ